MTQDKAKRIHLIYGCIAAVLIIALGIAMAVSCWDIYQSGPRPYTRTSIGEKLQDMCILICAVAAVIIGGLILNLVLPLDKKKPKALRDELITMQKLAAKAGTPNPDEKRAIEKLRRLRWMLPVLTGGVYGGLMANPVFYMLNKSNFPAIDPTAEIMAASLIILPPALIGLALCFICSVSVTKCILRETEVYKQIIASGNKAAATAVNTRKVLPTNVIRWAILAVAVVFIIAGIFNGSAADVLSKAVKICTECIGLG